MAQTQYRANLSAKDFVFLASQWGRSVIVKQFDQNFSRQIVSPTDPDKDVGIPQIFYCHNVMPAAQGFQSVNTAGLVAAIAGTTTFTYIRKYTNPNGADGQLGFVFVGDNINVYNLPFGTTSWTVVGSIPVEAAALLYDVTVCNINGTTYILIPFTNCYTFDGTTLAPVTLTGLDITTIQGITDSFGYMVAWSSTAIAWSSTVDATDFTPSLITGAGGGSVQSLKGSIFICYHHVFGFVIYSENNAVAAIYSGNSRYPFNFKEIIGAGGCTDTELVGFDAESGNQYAYTTYGLQLISTTQGVTVFPELTNFLGGNRMEDFDISLLQFIETDVSPGSLLKKLNVISNRYLVISYGITEYTHAVVYDIAMKRWGKIKVQHVASFEFRWLPTRDSARTSIGFVDETGLVAYVDFSLDQPASQGCMLLGKYQHTRNRTITLQQVIPENVPDITKCELYDLMTYDGKTFLPAVKLVPDGSGGISPSFSCRLTALNHSLLFLGSFELDSLFLAYTPNGRR